MKRARAGMMLAACCVMAGAMAAMGAANGPRTLTPAETAGLIGGSSGCDGNCDECVSLETGGGCGEVCFDEPGTACIDWWTGATSALPASDTAYTCDPSFPVGDPCVNAANDEAVIDSYACSCQAGLCTVDYTMPIHMEAECLAPGCGDPGL